MKADGIDEYAAEFEAFHARFARFFVRSEPREAARGYIRGLLAPLAAVALLNYMGIRAVFLVCFGVVMVGTLLMVWVVLRRKELSAHPAYQ